MTIETYPEMNAEIVGLLRICSDDPSLLYAAQRIEELEAEVERLRGRLGQIKASFDHEVGSRVRAELEVERLQHELHDEQVQCRKWEKIYKAIANPTPDAPPCGHPREAARGDVTQWCTMCEAENWRVCATINRLISNLPSACETLDEQGRRNLALQLRNDRDNLVYWQEHGGLVEAKE